MFNIVYLALLKVTVVVVMVDFVVVNAIVVAILGRGLFPKVEATHLQTI